MENKCKCGYEIEHNKVVHETEYTKWGWFLFTILGLSAKPSKVKFICSECGEIILETREPAVLSKFVGR
jgi:hypothetical protein